MSSEPRVTVVVPVHNGRETLAASIGSVLIQTESHLELIVVDDGSTDGTHLLVEAYDDPRVRCERRPKSGRSYARNVGIELARTPFIAFLDADDEWTPTKLEQQLQCMSDRTIVYSDALFRDARTGEDLGGYELFDRFPDDRAKFHGSILSTLLAQNVVPISTAVMPAALARSIGGFREELLFSEDWDFWLRCAERATFLRIDGATAIIRRRPDQLDRDRPHLQQSGLVVLDSARQRLRNSGELDGLALRQLGIGYLTNRTIAPAVGCLAGAVVRRPFDAVAWKALAIAALWRPRRWYQRVTRR
jgi:glycosyltransferase involved in cell wall biosynthesis